MSGAAADAVVQSSPRIFRSANCAFGDAGSRGTNRGVVQIRGTTPAGAGRSWPCGIPVIFMRSMIVLSRRDRNPVTLRHRRLRELRYPGRKAQRTNCGARTPKPGARGGQ